MFLPKSDISTITKFPQVTSILYRINIFLTDFIQFIFYKIVCISKLLRFFISFLSSQGSYFPEYCTTIVQYGEALADTHCRDAEQHRASVSPFRKADTSYMCIPPITFFRLVLKKQCLYRPFPLRCSTTTISTFCFKKFISSGIQTSFLIRYKFFLFSYKLRLLKNS